MATAFLSPPLSSHRYAFAVSFLLFLLFVLFFTNRALEPSIALYLQLTPISHSSHTFHPSPPSNPSIAGIPTSVRNISLPLFENATTDPAAANVPGNISLPFSENATTDAPPSDNVAGNISLPRSENATTDAVAGNATTDVDAGNVAGVEEKERGPSEMAIWDTDCDLYAGSWVKDESYPLYAPGSCPYADEGFSCQANGRPDLGYTKWRWKPSGCDIPRFNATDFLERLRGKRLMLVGDSMNRNQFESILCLLREALPDKSRMFETRGNKISKGRGQYIFRFLDFDCTVEFIRSHYIVREGVHTVSEGKTRPTLSIDRIDKFSGRWKGADIIVFNTGHWWTHGKTSRGKNYYQEGNFIYPQFDPVEAFRRAMKTWGKWVKDNMDPAQKLVFYRGYSTAHFRGGDWDSGGTCNGETEPIMNGTFLDGYPWKMRIVEEVMQDFKVPAILLNVTRLTNFRKDGHPSIYGKTALEGQKRSTRRRQDCSHWCLPGVPDAWNELIYASLVMGKAASWNPRR